jgi:hypothetical protein
MNRKRKPWLPRLLVATALVSVWAAGSGCSKRKSNEEGTGSGGDPAAPPRIGVQEADRGRQACQSYADQVCDCALKIADLTSECDLARSRPSALDMNLRAAMAEGNATERDRRVIQANARKIAQACIEDAAALVTRGCPISRAEPGARESPPQPGGTPAQAPAPAPESDRTR